jgi:transposase-like protein
MMGRAQARFTLQEKEAIVAEAYAQPGKIKETARLYNVQPKDIRYWAKTLNAARKVLSPSKWTKSRSRLSLIPGKHAKHHESDDLLYTFLQNMWEQNLKVMVRLMCAEYKRLNMEDCSISNFIIR